MEAYSQYYIKQKQSPLPVVLIVTDENPAGVTITVKDNTEGGTMTSFNLPRQEMIEALEYILMKIKARPVGEPSAACR